MSFYTSEQMEAELRRIADGLHDGSTHVSDLPFRLAVVVRSAQAMGQEAARAADIPNLYTRGTDVVFPIEVQTPSESSSDDDVDVFTREDAETIYQAAIRGEILTSVHERTLDIYEPAWRTHRRQFGRSPSHPLWGKTEAPKVGLRRSAILSTSTLSVLERYAETLASQANVDMPVLGLNAEEAEASRQLAAVAVATLAVARGASWASAHRDRVRSTGQDGIMLVVVYENRPLALADALTAMAERERFRFEEGVKVDEEAVEALLLLAEAMKKIHEATKERPETPEAPRTIPKGAKG